VHRTFLEYFCAWYFVWQFKEKQTLTIEDLKREVFAQHWRDPAWHEVLRLIAGTIDARFAAVLIDGLLEESGFSEEFANVFLAAECLGEVRNRHPTAAAANRALDRLESLAGRSESWIAIKAVRAIATHWKDHPDTLPLLKILGSSSEHWEVRVTAAVQLAQGWPNDPDTLPLLVALVRADTSESVRVTAVAQLAKCWPADPNILPLLKTLAQLDDSDYVRATPWP
jgi:HEAT repeat protein